MIVAGMSWLLAGVVAGSLSESATQLAPLRAANQFHLSGLLVTWRHGMYQAITAQSHQEFFDRYAQLMSATGHWLWMQLRLLCAQVLVGGGVYLLAWAMISLVAWEMYTQLPSVGRDLLFMAGAAVTFTLCKRHRRLR